MFYQEQEKTVLLNLLSRILPHHSSREFREQLMAQSSESLRQIARNNLERVASIQLMDLGVQPHMMGYAYCRSAICQVLSNPVHQGKRAPACYGKIATEFNKTAESVERAMRLAIHNAWEHYPHMKSMLQFQYCPTNLEFIAKVAELIRVQYL